MHAGSHFSLGTYTDFKWRVIQLEPLEFEIRYDGGTLASTGVRYVMFNSRLHYCFVCGDLITLFGSHFVSTMILCW